jgi:transposase
VRECHPHVDLPRPVVGGQQPQRRLVPVRRRRGRALRGGDAGTEQERDRLLVARARRLLDVAGALGRSGSARGERGGRARMCAQPPAARRGLVDRPAHERMAEAEAPRDRGRAHEVEREQAVERGQAVGHRELGDRRREVGLERLAGDRGSLEQRALGGGQGGQLLGQ